MTDMIYDYITTGVDLLINAIILSGIIMLLYTSSSLAQTISTQEYATEKVKYYREYNIFDNREVSCSDVVGAVLYYRPSLSIVIKDEAGNVVLRCNGGEVIDSSGSILGTVNSNVITDYLNVDKYYDAHIFCDNLPMTDMSNEGLNGTVTGLVFIERH